jgi:glycosyltransferase involved in cell wall biosynthesis
VIIRPKVSAVIPAHNSASTIARALDSVLAQTRPPDEIIVVDDNSSDDTVDVVTAHGSRAIRLLQLPVQLGAGAARNRGIIEATGELVAFLDADDEWLESKLEKQVALIESDPRISFVASDVIFVSPDGTDLGDLFRCACVVTGPDSWKALLACNFVATSAVLARRAHLLALGSFDARLKVAEDQDLFIRLALLGSFEYVHQTLVRQHEREVSLSTWNLDDLLTYTLPMVESHIASLRYRLSDSEIRGIRGERLSRFGRVAYTRGDFLNGVRLMGRAVLLGYKPFQNIYYIVGASPLATRFKRWIRLANNSFGFKLGGRHVDQ